MRRSLRSSAAFAICVWFALVALAVNGASQADSPRVAALAREVQRGNREAIAGFWADLAGKAPLVEAIPGQTKQRRVTFVWRATNKTMRVTMVGGLPGPNILKPLTPLADTDLWYLSEVHSTEARFQYVFHVDGPEALPMEEPAIMKEFQRNPPRVDPLNTNQYAGFSCVELPDAPPQPWINRREGVPARRKTQEKFKSRILNAEYPLNIYTPPGYAEAGRPCWLMIAFDGGFRRMDVTLDNLFSAGKIPSVVVVGVQNLSAQSRMRDLNASDQFAAFLAKELAPWARKTFRVHDDPAHTIVGGISLGGKMAVYCGLKHSEVFGKVLSQSGTFITGQDPGPPRALWEDEAPGMLAIQFLQSPRLPLDFYLEVGRYETTLPFSPLLETRRLRDILNAKGYRVTYSEFVGGHNEVCWRGSFADAIIALAATR